jgi:hypothetical protein
MRAAEMTKPTDKRVGLLKKKKTCVCEGGEQEISRTPSDWPFVDSGLLLTTLEEERQRLQETTTAQKAIDEETQPKLEGIELDMRRAISLVKSDQSTGSHNKQTGIISEQCCTRNSRKRFFSKRSAHNGLNS